jgi:hypothetical protein
MPVRAKLFLTDIQKPFEPLCLQGFFITFCDLIKLDSYA